MMLPLENRSNKILAIHIRAISLEFTRYTLHIIAAGGKRYVSNESHRSMVIESIYHSFPNSN
jgi:hypothetical protein